MQRQIVMTEEEYILLEKRIERLENEAHDKTTIIKQYRGDIEHVSHMVSRWLNMSMDNLGVETSIKWLQDDITQMILKNEDAKKHLKMK